MTSGASLIQKISAYISLGATIFLVFWTFLGGLSFAEWYQPIFYLTVVGFSLIAIPSYLLIIMGRSKTLILKRSILLIAAIVFVVFILLNVGVLQDMLGVKCTDLWGWNAEPCVKATSFWVFYILLYPAFFVPSLLVLSILLIIGLAKEYRIKNRN